MLPGPPHRDPRCESGADSAIQAEDALDPRAGSCVLVAAFDREPDTDGNGSNIILIPKASRERSDDTLLLYQPKC